MKIQDTLKRAYDELPREFKTRPSQICEVSPAYFNRIVKGEPKGKDIYVEALDAVIQTGEEFKEWAMDKADRIINCKSNAE
ncbi:hypothetical protein [Aquimarina algiphila]|uniref:Uncharacterized protein n=1 Tax=Aquimarina algiphila TaxID=2047982 RepID=A0A554VFA7_9FLAO|nr:hypothetical protein [Aquimarina algiphila]TSE05830.1 hypothetical protein FOF46_21575 [Aquimarina algiphila]